MATKNFAANLKIGASMGSSVGRVFGSVKSKIKEQETTLRKLRAAYKDASRGTGEYVGKLDELQKEIAQTEAKLKRLKAAMDVGSAARNFGSKFYSDAKRLAVGAGIAAAAVTAVGGAIFTTTKGFVDWADDIGDSAEALQMSTQALQTWQFAAATVGVGGSKMTASIAKFSKAVMEGGKKTDAVLGKLGINAKRLRKLKLDDQIKVTAEAFKRYKGADKAALAMKLFGKSGYQLTGVLSQGAKAYDEWLKLGIKTGAILDKEGTEKVNAAASAMDKMGMATTGIRNKIAMGFTPALTTLADKLTDFAIKNGDQIQKWAEKVGSAFEEDVLPKILNLIDQIPGAVEKLGQLIDKVWDGAKAAKEMAGGWENLGIALVALNFAPTIISLGKLTKALYGIGASFVAATGPVGIVVGAIAGIGLVIASIIDPGGPLDILGRMFPETMETIRRKIKGPVEWIGDKLDAMGEKALSAAKRVGKATGLDQYFTDYSGTSSGDLKRQYDLPRSNYGSIIGTMPKGEKNPLSVDMPAPSAPAATKEDLLEYLKPQSNNTYNINVNAPGANGDDIAERIRRSFERKPLFDADGALAPG